MSESQIKTQATFVGREAELHQLHKILDISMRSKTPRFVLIQGDVGVGKTALVDQFLAQAVTARPNILLGRGKCTRETEFSGLTPFIHLLSSLSDRGLQRRAAMDEWFTFLKDVAPAWIDIFTGGVAGALVTTAEGSSKLLGRRSFTQENVFVQFSNAIGHLTKKQPLIAFIDDLQWAGTSSLNLLFHLARYLTEQPVLVVCTYRPVEAMETGEDAALFCDIRANLLRFGAVEINLQQGIQVAGYVAQRFPVNRFPADFIARVQQITGGHALFVSQLFALWQDTGVVNEESRSDGKTVWRLTGEIGEHPSIPALGEVLDQRIRLLEEELREILTCASVEGEDFTLQVIARLQQLDEYQVCQSLEALDQRYRLVKEKDTKEVVGLVLDFYQFAHRYFHEHIYQQLGPSKRRILHRRVGECLEALYQDRREVAAQLALHFREALLPLKAAQYALLAAQSEQAHHVFAESEKWCRVGLSLLEPVPADGEVSALKLDLLEQLADGQFYSGMYGQADETYRAALLLAAEIGANASQSAGLYDRLAEISDYKGDLQEAMVLVERGRKILRDEGGEPGAVHFRLDVTRAWLQGKSDDRLAIEGLQSALEAAKDLPPSLEVKYTRARAHHALAISVSSVSRFAESIAHEEQAIKIARELGDQRLEAISMLNMANDLYWLHNLEESSARTSEALEIAERIGDLDEMAWAHQERGAVLVLLGRYREAIADLDRATTLAERVGALWNMPSSHADLALAYLGLSELDTAFEHARLGISYGDKQELTEGYQMGYALTVLGQVETARQDWQAALQHFDEALALHASVGDSHLVAWTQRHMAKALIDQGMVRESVDLLQAALATFRELRLDYEIEEAQKLLDVAQSSIPDQERE